MDFLFPIIAFTSVFVGTRVTLGWGFTAACAVGYFSGVIRANYLGIFTTFMFDFAMLGLYLGFLTRPGVDLMELLSRPSGRWTMAMIAWPTILTLMPVNDYMVQLVALRATVWFLPVLLIAARLNAHDLKIFARAVAMLNLCALAGGIYVYFNGVQALYPENAVTDIIYKSRDVGQGQQYHRVPSTFLNAHAYGGAMLFSLALLLDRVFSKKVTQMDRTLAIAGVGAAVIGILLCAARQPMIVFGITAIVALLCTRFNMVIGSIALGLIVLTLGLASTDERLQRAIGIWEDTGVLSTRLASSANPELIDLFFENALGAGMGSSIGTSIPYFLASRAPKAIGLENEYCRILIDQGWLGLAIWGGFLFWLFRQPPVLRLNSNWGIGISLTYALCLTNWMTAFVGTGTLASVPGAFLLLTHMGVLVRVRESNLEPAPRRRKAPEIPIAGQEPVLAQGRQ